MDLKDFYNDGFGWICRQCQVEINDDDSGRSRLMREGEAESKTPELSTKALAKWVDPARTTLMCPQCGLTERVEG